MIRLKISKCLCRSLATTNPIESVMDTTRTITGRDHRSGGARHWQDGPMRQRWCGSGLLKAEQRFRRIKGYKDIPKLLESLDAAIPNSSRVKKSKTKINPKSQ